MIDIYVQIGFFFTRVWIFLLCCWAVSSWTCSTIAYAQGWEKFYNSDDDLTLWEILNPRFTKCVFFVFTVVGSLLIFGSLFIQLFWPIAIPGSIIYAIATYYRNKNLRLKRAMSELSGE